MKKLIKTAIIKTLPVMAGYIVLGFGFGIISEKNGYGLLWALAMSLFVYAGSMQYVMISLLTSGASIITTALTTLMVNARHLFYGVSMIEPYKKAGKFKPYLIFGLTDETYSLVCSGKGPDGLNFHKYSFFVSLFNHMYWITGTLLGVLAGTIIKFNTAGVDFAMTALFITVFVEQWKSTKNHIPAIIGVVASVICLMIFGSDNFLIPTMILIGLSLSLGRRFIDKEEA
ncbi:MAG: branched-chain amino acid transporter AzlC [Lachnospiraceae bacterium]|nr:branched-chain amino acid transporter AzlC [Lachnospiraceae bacterium]